MTSLVFRPHHILAFLVVFMTFATSHTLSAPSTGHAAPGNEAVLLAFGDSLFAGYGVAEQDAFPAVLEARLRGQAIPSGWSTPGFPGIPRPTAWTGWNGCWPGYRRIAKFWQFLN